MKPSQLIENYIKLRNKMNEIKAKHEAELEPFASTMRQIEAELLTHLNENELDNIKAEAGTAYKQVMTSCSVEDWGQALGYVRKHDAWDLLEARIAKRAALTTIEETGEPIPGLKISQAIVLRVRSA